VPTDKHSGQIKHIITQHNKWVDYGSGRGGGLHAYTYCGWLAVDPGMEQAYSYGSWWKHPDCQPMTCPHCVHVAGCGSDGDARCETGHLGPCPYTPGYRASHGITAPAWEEQAWTQVHADGPGAVWSWLEAHAPGSDDAASVVAWALAGGRCTFSHDGVSYLVASGGRGLVALSARSAPAPWPHPGDETARVLAEHGTPLSRATYAIHEAHRLHDSEAESRPHLASLARYHRAQRLRAVLTAYDAGRPGARDDNYLIAQARALARQPGEPEHQPEP
jgi:hypothetical protein